MIHDAGLEAVGECEFRPVIDRERRVASDHDPPDLAPCAAFIGHGGGKRNPDRPKAEGDNGVEIEKQIVAGEGCSSAYQFTPSISR